MDIAAVVLAAAPGDRPSAELPTALRLLGGIPLVAHAVAALRDSDVVDQVVVVASRDQSNEVRRALDSCVPRHRAQVVPVPPGSRHSSLHSGLSEVDSRVSTVVVQDVARPLVPADLIVRVVKAVHDGADVAVPVLGITETVKELDADGRIVATVPRETLVRLQAPRAIRRQLLDTAHAVCDLARLEDLTDPLTALACQVVTVAGDDDAFPVLGPNDLAFAEAVLARRHAAH